jgi:hypothetical protein
MCGFWDNERGEQLDLEYILLDMLDCGFRDNEPDLGQGMNWSLRSCSLSELPHEAQKFPLSAGEDRGFLGV